MLSRNNLAADLYLKTQKYGERSKLDLVDGKILDKHVGLTKEQQRYYMSQLQRMRNSRVDPKLAHRHFKRVNTVHATIKRMHSHWGKRTQSLPGDPNEEAIR